MTVNLKNRPRSMKFKVEDWPLPLAELPCLLTKAEMRVLLGAARGESQGTTARRLFVTLHTVKTHRGNILGRLNAGTMAQAVALAVMAGWVTESELRAAWRAPE